MNRSVVFAMMVFAALASTGCKNAKALDSFLGTAIKRPDLEIATVAVKTQLVQIARAEQRYQVMYSRYGTIDELMTDGLLTTKPDRNDYEFTAEIQNPDKFKITAMTNNPSKQDWPVFYIDEMMQVVQVGAAGDNKP